jgi:hypothetical protein
VADIVPRAPAAIDHVPLPVVREDFVVATAAFDGIDAPVRGSLERVDGVCAASAREQVGAVESDQVVTTGAAEDLVRIYFRTLVEGGMILEIPFESGSPVN